MDVEREIKERFCGVALDPHTERKFLVGPESAKALGYDVKTVDALPASVTESFAGVGRPLAIGEPRHGATVLDIGCGAGLDVLLAAREVGREGKVIGVDFVPEMIEKARRNAALLEILNAEFHVGRADALPVGDASVDVVISNGVFNLCVDKPAVVAEAFRVLRSGGRIQMADILLEQDLTAEEIARKGTWSD